MPDTPKPYTDKEITAERAACSPCRHDDYCGDTYVGRPCTECSITERWLATLAERDRKLAIAREALGAVSEELHLHDSEEDLDDDSGRTRIVNPYENVLFQVDEALAEIEQLTTPPQE